MTKQNLAANPTWGHVPAKFKTHADTGCSGCPIASLHPSCGAISVNEPATEDELFSVRWMANLQWGCQRRAIDADGVPGSYNELGSDYWFPYRAMNSNNYADSWSFEVTAISGTQITLKTLDGSSAGHVALFTYRLRDSQTGTRWVNGFTKTGSTMPGDIIQFNGNSKLSNLCWPVITRIISIVGDTMVVDTDKAATAALTKIDTEDVNPITCKVWQHAANAPSWRKLIKPDPFFGLLRQKTLQASEIPADGVYTLITDGQVKDTKTLDPLTPGWVMEGRPLMSSTWESVPQMNERLFITPTQSWVAFKTSKPARGKETITLTDDLTATYSAFRLTYYERNDGTGSNCVHVGHGRCMWSIPDPTKSVGNSVGTVGVGKTGEGETETHYICMKLNYDYHDIRDNYPEPTPDGIDDTAVHELKQPTMIDLYPADGQCGGLNCCDFYQSAEDGGEFEPFSYKKHVGPALLQAWGGVHQRLVRVIPRLASFSAWQAECVEVPGLMWHAGYVGLQTATTIDDQDAVFRGHGLWGTPYTYTDIDGNEHLGTLQGGFDGYRFDDIDLDPDGNFAGIVSGWTTAKDPLAPATPIIQREMERLAPLVEKTTGQLQTHRSIAQSSRAVDAQEIVLPNIDLAESKTCERGEFVKGEGGDPDRVKLFPLRQELKAPAALGQRQVYNKTSLGDGRVSIELNPVGHVWTYINDGPDIGDSYDARITFMGGGGWPIVPKPHQQIQSAAEPHKYAGSRYAGAWRGDALGVGSRRFLIDSTTPFGGSEALNWGGSYYNRYGYVSDGVWRPDEANTLIPDTAPDEHGDITISSVVDLGDSSALTLVDSAERPATIATETYWFDNGVLYPSPADNGKTLQISYTVEGKVGTFTESYLVPVVWELQTNIPVADWIGADAKTVTAGEELTLVSGPALADGQYYIDTTGTHVKIFGHLYQGGLPVEISLRFDVDAPAPDDGWAIGGGLLSFGKKRDVVVAYDDADGHLMALSPGDWVDFYHCDVVMKPGATLVCSPYQVDDWQPVPCEVQHGTGEFVIDPAWVPPAAIVCFKAVGVELMDHRGIVPAEVVIKTQAALDSLQWVTTNMSGGSGDFGIDKVAIQNWDRGINLDTCALYDSAGEVSEEDGSGLPGNGFVIESTSSGETEVELKVSASSFGPPLPLSRIPDGAVILEAKAEIISSGLTRTYTYGAAGIVDCDGVTVDPGTPTTVTTTLSDINYSIIGFTGAGAFETIATIPGGSNGTRVVDITGLIQTMLTDRTVGKYRLGYGALFSPVGAGVGVSVAGFLPGEPATRSRTRGWCESCAGVSQVEYFEDKKVELAWGSLSFGNVVIKIQYPDSDKQRVMPLGYRWPSLRPPEA